MCRVGLIKGFAVGGVKKLARLQANGSNKIPEFFKVEDFTIVLNRFDVTSNELSNGTYPLEGDRYVLAYNGEVFEYKNLTFNNSSFKSDVHFALHFLEKDGINGFFTKADFQGTFIVYDKVEKYFYVIVDQLNTAGGFYSQYDNNLIIAQEFAIINEILNDNNIPDSHPIHIIKNGTFLRIDTKTNKIEEIEYRPQYKSLWSGTEDNLPLLETISKKFNLILRRTIENRIPKIGEFGILLSGGVDSSIIFMHLLDILKEKNELSRLKVFTLGQEQLPVGEAENDLLNVKYLLHNLNIDNILEVIPIQFTWIDKLLRRKVFSKNARLITPNPSQTQIRHTVQMSCVLAQIAYNHPQIKCVLTGDFADEIFAGYFSMHDNVLNTNELALNVRDKLNDLPLNDASRVALASLHGTVSILKEVYLKEALNSIHLYKIGDILSDVDELTSDEIMACLKDEDLLTDELRSILPKIKPIEVRTPFSSHYILDFIQKINSNFLIGKIDDRIYTKFLLRAAALDLNMPKKIALRKKMPFNEGATGIKNGERDQFEYKNALSYFSEGKDVRNGLYIDVKRLSQLGLIKRNSDYEKFVEMEFEKFCFFLSSKNAGLVRLMNNEVFRNKMPDSNYPSEGKVNYQNVKFKLSTEHIQNMKE